MTEYQPGLFDDGESRRRKRDGMAKAEANMEEASTLLTQARAKAREIAMRRPGRTVTADDVGHAMDGVSLGPAAGSLFKSGDWEFTGQRVRSTRTTNHSRELKVWRLVKC